MDEELAGRKASLTMLNKNVNTQMSGYDFICPSMINIIPPPNKVNSCTL